MTKSRLIKDHVKELLTNQVSENQKDVRRACWAIAKGINRYNLMSKELLNVCTPFATEKDE
jgi:hypothetical protein